MLNKRIYSIEEIKRLPSTLIILIIDGGVYDVTEFLNSHPGGREILEKFNRKDASKAFQLTHHSKEALQMLPKYCVGVLEGYEEQFKNNYEIVSSDSSFFSNVRKKLFTHEDKFHIHKALGVLVLGHFVVRMTLLILGVVVFLLYSDRSLFLLNLQLNPAWLLITMALIHGMLSLSSLLFQVPRKASQSKPMIHGLFRAHSITFALRAVACMIIYVLFQGEEKVWGVLLISMVVLISFVIADIISKKFDDKDDRFDTTASMPYWFGVSPERHATHKFLYGFAQFLATFVCLSGGYAGTLYTLAPIQGAAFGMTLVRKGIMSARTYHNIYLISLFLPVPFAFCFFPIRVTAGLLVALFLFYLRTRGVNKYLLWLPLLLLWNIFLIPVTYRLNFSVGVATISMFLVFINLLYLKLKKEQRIDKNNRMIERKKISKDAFELIIRTKLPMTILPGQHVIIRLSDHLERKYTPIWSKYLESSDQTLLCLRIKLYESKQHQTASSYLTSCPINTVLDLHGPVGEKFYCDKNKSIVDRIHELTIEPKTTNIYLFSAGSGITPIFQLAKAICEQGDPLTLVTCDKSPEYLIMKQEISELKHQFPELLTWVSIFSHGSSDFKISDAVINKRLQPDMLDSLLNNKSNKEDAVIICGPEQWQTMISKTLNKNIKIVTW